MLFVRQEWQGEEPEGSLRTLFKCDRIFNFVAKRQTDRVSGSQELVSVLKEGGMCGEQRKNEVEQMEETEDGKVRDRQIISHPGLAHSSHQGMQNYPCSFP